MLIEEPHQYKNFIPNMNYWRELLYLLCIWSGQRFAVGESKSIIDHISEEIYSCNFTRFEIQLERMKLQTAINQDPQPRQKKELFGNLERKFKLKSIEDNSIPKIYQLKFYQDIQQYLNATEKYLKDENQSRTSTNQSYPTSCADFDANYCAINKCVIKNHLYGLAPFFVACDKSVDGGGWTVIQRRINGAVDIYRYWSEYKHGFGDNNGEFFIELEKLYALTSTLKPVELLIQLQDIENVTKFAKFDDFQVGNEADNYKFIKVGSYTGDAEDSVILHVCYNFSTRDRDNDISDRNCAKDYTAAWWYHDSHHSNLNGKYYEHPKKFYNAKIHNTGINWGSCHGYRYSLKGVQMLIKPRKW